MVSNVTYTGIQETHFFFDNWFNDSAETQTPLTLVYPK